MQGAAVLATLRAEKRTTRLSDAHQSGSQEMARSTSWERHKMRHLVAAAAGKRKAPRRLCSAGAGVLRGIGLACVLVRVRGARLRKLRLPGAEAAVVGLCEDELRAVGFVY